MTFKLASEYDYPYVTIRNYVSGRQFINIWVRGIKDVVVETTHPSLHRLVVASVDEAIAAVKKLSWEVA